LQSQHFKNGDLTIKLTIKKWKTFEIEKFKKGYAKGTYLEELILEAEEKKETEAQSCLDRIWYSLNWSAKFDRVIIFIVCLFASISLSFISSSSSRRRQQWRPLRNQRKSVEVGRFDFSVWLGLVACLCPYKNSLLFGLNMCKWASARWAVLN
jgi:hypothetical protein